MTSPDYFQNRRLRKVHKSLSDHIQLGSYQRSARAIGFSRRYDPLTADADARLIYYAIETHKGDIAKESELLNSLSIYPEWITRVLDEIASNRAKGFAWSVEDAEIEFIETFYVFFQSPEKTTPSAYLIEFLCSIGFSHVAPSENEALYFLSLDICGGRVVELKTYAFVIDPSKIFLFSKIEIPTHVLEYTRKVVLCRRYNSAGEQSSVKPELFPKGAVGFLQNAIREWLNISVMSDLDELENTHFALDFAVNGELNKITGYLEPAKNALSAKYKASRTHFLNSLHMPKSGHPAWAITGNLATQIHLLNSQAADLTRPTAQLEIYSFFNTLAGHSIPRWERFSCTRDLFQPMSLLERRDTDQLHADVWHDFHNGLLLPSAKDVTMMPLDQSYVPVIRPEFLFVSMCLPALATASSDTLNAQAILRAIDLDVTYMSEVVARSPFAPFLPEIACADDLIASQTAHCITGRLLLRLDPAIQDLFSTVDSKSLFLLVTIDRDSIAHLSLARLLSWIDKSPIEFLTKAEQAFALFLIAHKTPEANGNDAINAQELICEALIRTAGRVNRARFFSLAAFWGQYLHPLLRSPIARELQSGFARTTDCERFLIQASTLSRYRIPFYQ